MKQFKLTSAVLVLSFATPIFAVQANDTAATNDELRTELQQIQQRLAMLEAQEKRHRFYRILSLILWFFTPDFRPDPH